MNKILHLLILLVAFSTANAATNKSAYEGVCSYNNAEVVLTSSSTQNSVQDNGWEEIGDVKLIGAYYWEGKHYLTAIGTLYVKSIGNKFIYSMIVDGHKYVVNNSETTFEVKYEGVKENAYITMPFFLKDKNSTSRFDVVMFFNVPQW